MRLMDGITSMVNTLTNRRDSLRTNRVDSHRMSEYEMRQCYRTGLGNKIIRLKAGNALADTLHFSTEKDAEEYEAKLAKVVKKAAKFMVAFGRGVVLMYQPGDDLSTPLADNVNPHRLKLRAFSGDMVTSTSVSIDLTDDRYMRPLYYMIRGVSIHHSRIVDFTYVEPVEDDASMYQYGGISEFELIREQMISDGIVERAGARIVERNSTFVYKIKGFKEALRQGRESDMVKYMGATEDARSIYGAALLDMEDEAQTVDQTLTNLADVDNITLRRLAMVTGTPLAILVGENVQGLNSTGDNEMQVYQDMLEQFQQDYLQEGITILCIRMGIQFEGFKDNQGETPFTRVEYEAKAIDSALKLYNMGEDAARYLQDKDIVKRDSWADLFDKDDTPEATGAATPEASNLMASFLGGSNGQA